MAIIDTKNLPASAGLASVGGQQFANAAEAEAGAQRLAQAVGHEAVVVKDERDHFWVVKASDLARLPAATAPSRSTDPKRALAPGKSAGVRGFQVVKTAKPVAAVALLPSTREAAVTTGERLLSAYSRQSELLLNAVYADKYVDWIDTFGNTKRLRPADASTVMLRLNASIWSVVRDLRNGTVPPADVGLPQGTKWESAKAQVPARALYDLAMKRLHADSLDYDKVIPEMLKDPLWAKQPIVINDPEKGTYPLSPDKVSWLQKSEYVFFAPNNASETAEKLPIVRSLRDHAVAEAEAAPDRAPAVADANLVHTAYGLSRGKGLAANNSQATLAMSVAAQVPLIVPELAEPGTKLDDLKAKQRTGEIAGFKELNGSVIVFRPKTVEAVSREVRAKIDAGQLAHLGPEALRELKELTGPDGALGKDLAKRLESEGRSRFWRSTTGEIVDMALIGVASGGIASFAEGVAVGMRAAPAVIKGANFLANSATFTTLSGISHGQLSADRYAIDVGMFAVLGQAGRFSALAGKLIPGNTAALRFLQGAAAQTATVGTSATLLTGFGALESAVRGDPLSKKEVWQQFGHNLLVVGTLHAVNQGIARLTPQMAAGARVQDEIERLRTRADRANAALTGALDELSFILVDAAKTPAGTPKQAQLTQRAEQVLAKVAAERKTVERLSNDVKDFARRSLPPEQGKALLRDIEGVEQTLGLAGQITANQAEVKAAVAGKTSASRQAERLEQVANRVQRSATDAAPLADFFDLKGEDAKTLGGRTQRVQQQAARAKAFKESFAKLSTVEELRAFADREVRSPLTLGQRAEVFKAFMDKSEFGDAVRFYEQSAKVDRSFARAQVPRELYIVGLNKTGQLAKSITEAQRYVREFTRGEGIKGLDLSTISEQSPAVRQASRLNGEILGGLGKAMKLVSQQAAKGPLDAELQTIVREAGKIPAGKTLTQAEYSKLALELSTRYYEAGFVADMEYYPGINAVYNNIALGKVERAEQLAQLVKFSAKLEGGLRSTDYWALATQLEAALIGREHTGISNIFRSTLEQAKVGWNMGSTADNMEMVAGLRAKAGEQPGAMNVVAQKLRELSKIDSGGKPPSREWIDAAVRDLDAAVGPVGQAPVADLSPVTKAIFENSFHFRGINSHFVGGNVGFGGAVPDIPVNRNDVGLARQALKRLNLSQVTDFETFDQRVSPFLDKTYRLADASGTRPLEDLHSPQHDFLDSFRGNLLQTTRARETGDSRTNLMAEMAMGNGDCRQVGFSKQLLFDVWKGDNQKRLSRNAFDALKTGNTAAYQAAMRSAEALERIQLVTFTNLVQAPVVGEMYKTQTDAQGRPVPSADGSFKPVENHTLNALIKMDGSGQVVGMEWRDSFYRQLYGFGKLQANPADILNPDGFSAGVMGVRNAAGQEIPVRMTPTKYSGAVHKPVQDEAGQFRVGGQEVAVPRQEILFGQDADLRQIVSYISTTPPTLTTSTPTDDDKKKKAAADVAKTPGAPIAVGEVQSQAILTGRVETAKPATIGFVKDQPILGYQIKSNRFEDIPEGIRKYIGAVDQTKYTPEYLGKNIGSMIALQMADGKPDFYVIGKETFDAKYQPVAVSQVQAKNAKLLKGLGGVEGVGALITGNDPGLIGALKTVPVEMISMSALGYPLGQEVKIQSPWGEQTKPAGKDAYVTWDASQKQYYMVNVGEDGLPLSYVRGATAAAPAPRVSAPAAVGEVQSQAILTGRVETAKPATIGFVKDQPILGYQIKSNRFEDIPEGIRKYIGAVDQTKYTPEYLGKNIGSMIALQMADGKPDFYVIGKETFDAKYQPVAVSQVQAKNAKLLKGLGGVEGVGALITGNDPGLIGALKTVPVEMISMSALGYPLGQEVKIQSPWGEQTKPAGKDAYVTWDASQKQYYMVNVGEDGLPLSYVRGATAAAPAPRVSAPAAVGEVQSQAILTGRVETAKPATIGFVKDQPILGYQIKSNRFEDIPEGIRKYIGAVDQTKYTPEYLGKNIGSMIALQMADGKPDFYVIGKETFDAKYQPVAVSQVQAKNAKLLKGLGGVEGVGALITGNDPGLIGALKTVPVEMISMSALGYPLGQEVKIQSPWGEQTKPAGKDAYVTWDASQKQYYMVNVGEDGLPLSYVRGATAAAPAPRVSAPAAVGEVQSQAILTGRVETAKPATIGFVKDQPILGYQIKSNRFEDIPEGIRKYIGAVDQTKYTPEYLGKNIGSMIALQMADGKPDFYVIGKETFDAKYQPVAVSQVQAKNAKLLKGLGGVEGVGALITGNDPGLIGALKTVPVEMISMSALGYPLGQEVKIQSPWGEQTKPAGKDAYVTWDASQKQYYMVNVGEDGLPLSYVRGAKSP